MHPLDNPIWNALTSNQAHLAQGDEWARRYPLRLAPFAATREQTPAAFAHLARVLQPERMAGFFARTLEPAPPGWTYLRTFEMLQMVCETLTPSTEPDLIELAAADSAAMLELVGLTKPGPFKENAAELGRFYGVRHTGQLVAMAGERMRLTGFTEISAVCTHPEHRGRGLARGLVHRLAREIQARGEQPFLHVAVNNTGAIRTYEALGFRERIILQGAVIQAPEETA